MSHNKTQKRLQAQGALERAVDHLGAVEVAPGRYALADHSGWYVANERGLIACATVPVSEGPSKGDCTEMPSWWTPERREAAKCAKCGTIVKGQQAQDTHQNSHPRSSHPFYAITADLETGEEIVCENS
ncbi:MAG: hypothetical protein ACYDB1_09560 [Acidiferrobacteraceae bacterium]